MRASVASSIAAMDASYGGPGGGGADVVADGGGGGGGAALVTTGAGVVGGAVVVGAIVVVTVVVVDVEVLLVLELDETAASAPSSVSASSPHALAVTRTTKAPRANRRICTRRVSPLVRRRVPRCGSRRGTPRAAAHALGAGR